MSLMVSGFSAQVSAFTGLWLLIFSQSPIYSKSFTHEPQDRRQITAQRSIGQRAEARSDQPGA